MAANSATFSDRRPTARPATCCSAVSAQRARTRAPVPSAFRTPLTSLHRALAGIYASIAVAMKGAAWRDTSMVMLAQALAASGKDDEAAGATESKGSTMAQEKAAHVAWQRRLMSSLCSSRRSKKAAQPSPTDASADPSEVVIQRHEPSDDGAGQSSTAAADVEPPATRRNPTALETPAAAPMAAQRH